MLISAAEEAPVEDGLLLGPCLWCFEAVEVAHESNGSLEIISESEDSMGAAVEESLVLVLVGMLGTYVEGST